MQEPCWTVAFGRGRKEPIGDMSDDKRNKQRIDRAIGSHEGSRGKSAKPELKR